MKKESPLFIYSHRKEIIKLLGKWMNKQHYDIRNLLECPSEYLIGFGEKSNGKSTACQMVGICLWLLFNKQMVLVRVFDEDFKKGRAEKMFSGVPDAFIKDVSKGVYDAIIYKNFKWYLAKYDSDMDKYILANDPFCFRQCILNAGSSFQMPEVEMIFFDEFISTRPNYPNEFIDFQTLVSTIIRLKDSVQVFMMGNTVNYFSIYFVEMGLKNIKKQKQGTIDTYSYGENEVMHVSVEFTDSIPLKEKSNKYFAFDNPKLEMIKNGSWQISNYPHLPYKYKPKDIILTYFIIFKEEIFQCEIISHEDTMFTYIHRKSTPIKNFDEDIIYQESDDPRMNISCNIKRPVFEFQKIIYSFFANNKVFYQDNEIGDTIRAYLSSCA